MNTRLLIICIIISFSVSIFSQSVEIARWKDNRTAAYSLNLDDFATHYFGDLNTIANVLDSTGLRISFATVANWSGCQGSCQDNAWNWANGRLKNHEFTNHSWSHPDMDGLTSSMFEQEVNVSQKTLEENIDSDIRFFIFSNDSKGEPGYVDFVRTGKYIGCGGGSGDINTYNMPDPFLTNLAYYMAGVNLNSTVNDAISTGNWGFRSAHNVGTGGWEPIPVQTFVDHMSYCKQKVESEELWMAPVSEVVMYIMEREKFYTNLVYEDDTLMDISWTTFVPINVSDSINNKDYDFPLTMIVINRFSDTIIFDSDPHDGHIIIKYDANDIKEVSQGGFKIFPAPSLSIDTSNYYITNSSGDFNMGINSSDGWTITSNVSWLSFNKETGTGNDNVNVSYLENTEIIERTASFTVSYHDFIIKKVEVVQEAGVAVEVNDLISDINEGKIIIYPNPVTDNLSIRSSIKSNANIHIYNMQGQRIISDFIDTNLTIDVGYLEKGMYFLILENEDELVSGKFIKQ